MRFRVQKMGKLQGGDCNKGRGVRFYFVKSFFNMVSLQEVSGAPPRSRLATEL